MATEEARHIAVAIERPWQEVVDFLSDPANFPAWASGLASGLRETPDGWLADGPGGPVRVHFSPPNGWGVVDHRVVLANGSEVSVPMRVLPNGDGSEVLFTLFRSRHMSADAFARDAAWVARDLQALKALLEGHAA